MGLGRKLVDRRPVCVAWGGGAVVPQPPAGLVCEGMGTIKDMAPPYCSWGHDASCNTMGWGARAPEVCGLGVAARVSIELFSTEPA